MVVDIQDDVRIDHGPLPDVLRLITCKGGPGASLGDFSISDPTSTGFGEQGRVTNMTCMCPSKLQQQN